MYNRESQNYFTEVRLEIKAELDIKHILTCIQGTLITRTE